MLKAFPDIFPTISTNTIIEDKKKEKGEERVRERNFWLRRCIHLLAVNPSKTDPEEEIFTYINFGSGKSEKLPF